MIDENVETTALWTDYRNGLAYQASSNMTEKLPKFVRFYEGNQWAKATQKTKNLPRPVINIVKMICRSKKSGILSTPVKIVYESDDGRVDVEKFNRFAEYIQKEIAQNVLDEKAIRDGVIKGSYFFHYYWDAEARGKDGIKEGALRCEIIDPLNIFFANPSETDEQKQKWILIATREDVDSVRAKCDNDVDKDSIVADDKENSYGEIEQDGNKLCTVLTRYFRKDGLVYCEKATKNVIVNKAFSLTPDISAAAKVLNGAEEKEDAPNNSLPDATDDNKSLIRQEGAYLYPIVAGQYEEKEKCIYGIGEVEGLIPNQKSINFNFAMALLACQKNSWGKYIVSPKALSGQTITDEPGQVLIDYDPNGNGIRKLAEQNVSGAPINIAETLMQLTRNVAGASEVMTGEVLKSSMSGAAIAQLQAQASQPIDELRKAYWFVKEKQGRVMAQFFKLFYDKKPFVYKKENEDSIESILDEFSGEEFANVGLDVAVEATSGTRASAAGDINILDALLSQNRISLKTYLNAYPKDALTNRSLILSGIKEDEESELMAAKQQATEYEERLKKATELLQRQNETVANVVAVIKENNTLKAYIAEREGVWRKEISQLQDEATRKINYANEQILKGNEEISALKTDATDFAREIAKRNGLLKSQQ